MNLTFLYQALANLTTRFNQIVENARTIAELPWQSVLRSASKLQVYNPENVSEFITVQQILDAALSYRQNQLLSIGTITVVGNNVTIPAGATWVINNIDYSNVADIVINVPYAEEGNTRTDIIVADTSNNMYRVNGPETAGVSPTPNVPLNTVLVTTINVTDSTIGYEPPIIGDIYVEKTNLFNKIYGTDSVGDQKLYDIQELKSLRWGSVVATNGGTRNISINEDVLAVSGSPITNYTINLPTVTEARTITIAFDSSISNLSIGASGVVDYFPPRVKAYDTWAWTYEPTNNRWVVQSYFSGDLGAQISSLPNKGILGDIDTFAISDGSSSGLPKSVTALNLFTNYIKTKSDLLYEKLTNKQDSLTVDGTGTKFPTVDVINLVTAFVSPNQFTGTDAQKIQSALNFAVANNKILRINRNASTGLDIWNIDTAILLKSNSKIIIDNVTLKLTNSSRDNFFRTENAGFGLTTPSANPLNNISITGIGNAILQGADNPRSTGDGGKALSISGSGFAFSYGSDTGVAGQTQTGDWRNIGVLMAYATNVVIQGLRYVNTHAWANSFERCKNVNVSNLTFSNIRDRTVSGVGVVACKNLDGIDFRLGCSLITVENISGYTDDDTVACTLISNGVKTPGVYGAMEVSGDIYGGSTDDIHDIYINNINASGRQNIVRLLNTGNTKLYNATIENVRDQATGVLQAGSTVILGSSDPTYGGTSPLGNFNNINIKNIINRFAPQAIKLENFISESSFSEIYQPSGTALNLTTGHRRLSITNVKIDSPTAGLPNVELLASVIGTTGGRTGIFTDSGNLAYLANMSWNISTEVNLDNYQSSGFYLTPNTGLNNLPATWTQQRYSMITVGTSNTSFRGQILFNSLTNDMAFRTSVSAGAFSAWKVTASKADITNAVTNAITNTSTAASTLILSVTSPLVSYYVFTGTTATWTLPVPAGNTTKKLALLNTGSGTVTVNTDSAANVLYNGGLPLVNTYALLSGSNVELYSDGSRWIIL